MLNVLSALVVGLSPVLIVGGLLALAEWRDRLRERIVARQIRLTDAIAAELGPVVAPVVRKRLWRPWQVEMAIPFGRPAVAARVLGIIERVLPGQYELVLTPQEPIAAAEPTSVFALRRVA